MRAALLLAAVLVLGGCSDDGDEPDEGLEISGAVPTEAAVDDDTVFPGGQPLGEYRGRPSYEWRVELVENLDDVDTILSRIEDPGLVELDESVYGYVISTCDDINSGKGDVVVTRNARLRWSNSPDEPIALATARDLVVVSQEYACPLAGR